jgi:hypothetical protein
VVSLSLESCLYTQHKRRLPPAAQRTCTCVAVLCALGAVAAHAAVLCQATITRVLVSKGQQVKLSPCVQGSRQ